MYGYVVMNKPELKIREYDEYRAYYCGLCKALKHAAGKRGQIALSYDMTFLALLLSALYEPETEKIQERCMIHPVGKQNTRKNEYIDYAADMSLLLAWYKCKDDYQDDKNYVKAAYGSTLNKQVRKLEQKYHRQSCVIKEQLEKLAVLENENTESIDVLSACFGNVLAEIFAARQDEWEKELRTFGFYLGKFVYIMDAYDDVEKDEKKNQFNPFMKKYKEDHFDDWVRQLLVLCASEFAKAFERMPILENAGILRNIIYSGVFCRYEVIHKKRAESMEKQYEKSI